MKQEDTNIATGRRSFLKGAGMTGLGIAGAAMIGSKLGSSNTPKVEAAAYSDLDILNFALNLEYLEAEFYSRGSAGGIPRPGRTPTPGRSA